MNPETQRMRDELIYEQVKGNRTLYLGLAIVYGVACVVSAVFTVICLMTGKGLGATAFILVMALSCGASAVGSWNFYRQHAKALAEIGDSPAGVDTCRTYSRGTAQIIAGSRKSAKVLQQQLIAYGLITIMLLAFGVLMFACLGMPQFQGKDNSLLVGVGALLVGMGIILLMLTVRAFREWSITRKIEQLG